MGIFKESITDEDILLKTFQVIAQSIDVAVQTGLDVKTNLEIGEVWALYFWTLKPFENQPEKISPNHYKTLIHTPGDLISRVNNTKSFEQPAKVIFPTHKDDYEVYLKVNLEIKVWLESHLLTKPTIDDRNWQEIAGTVEEIVKRNLPTLYTKSSFSVIFILLIALRSIFKDTNRLDKKTIEKLRKSGIFWVSLMICTWHFKLDAQM